MEANEYGERAADNSNICRLEWIAWAIEAARRHKDEERRNPAPPRALLDTEDDWT
jgi:hypothetical protein